MGSTLRPQFSQGVCSRGCVETEFLHLFNSPRQALSSAGVKPLLINEERKELPCDLNELNLLWVCWDLTGFNSLSFYLGLASCRFNFVPVWRASVRDQACPEMSGDGGGVAARIPRMLWPAGPHPIPSHAIPVCCRLLAFLLVLHCSRRWNKRWQ